MPTTKPKRVTIAQVAARAGTSPAAVSYVFNGRQGAVGDTKRKRILEVAEQLGYRPSRKARQLRKQANLVISAQFDSSITTNNAWRATSVLSLVMVQGMNSFASQRGYHLHMLVPAPGDDYRDISAQVLEENAFDGVALFGLVDLTDAQRREIVDGLKRCNVPAVTLDRTLAADGLPRVSVDLQPAIDAAAQRLVELGHRRIAYIGTRGSDMLSEWVSRFDLFDRALRAGGAGIAADMIIEQYGEIEVYEATCALLDRKPRPTAVIYTGDHIAMAGARAMLARGVQPGRDMSIVSFGNAPYADAAPVPLACIDQRHHEQGATLARVLFDQIDRPDIEPPSVTLVRSHFVDRASLGPALSTEKQP